MRTPLYKKILILLLVLVGIFGIWRTNSIQRFGGAGDMRNRVVGARLMKDGIVPYYYHWVPGAPLRYVMELDIDTTQSRKASSITSSPVFHRLSAPFSDYDEPIIDRGFFILFYVLLAIMILMVWYESKYLLLTLVFFIPFLFSDGWCFHILMGQVYFLFGFLFFLISFALLKKQYFFAGLLLALLFLLRLNSIVFIFPFFLLFRKYKVFIGGVVSGLVIYGLVLVATPFERENWKDYFEALNEYSEMHLHALSIKPGTVDCGPLPAETDILLPPVLEGQHFANMRAAKERTPETHVFHEVSNFFFIYKFVFKKPPTLLILNGILGASFGFITVVLLFLKKKYWRNNLPLEPLLFSGVLFYQLSNFLSPINAFPYYMPQWMTIAALMVIFYKKIPKVFFAFFLVGILENSIYTPTFVGKHMVTELIFILTTFCVLIFSCWEPKVKNRIAI